MSNSMRSDLDRIARRIVMRRRLDAIAARIVANRTPSAPPVLNLSTDTLMVHAGSAGLQAGIVSLSVESVPVSLTLDPHIEVHPPALPVTVNVAAAEMDLSPIGQMVADAVREVGQQIVAALREQKVPEVTVEPAKVVMPARKPVAFRIERDSGGATRIVQEG